MYTLSIGDTLAWKVVCRSGLDPTVIIHLTVCSKIGVAFLYGFCQRQRSETAVICNMGKSSKTLVLYMHLISGIIAAPGTEGYH